MWRALLVFFLCYLGLLVFQLLDQFGYADPYRADLINFTVSRYGATYMDKISAGNRFFTITAKDSCIVFAPSHFLWLVRAGDSASWTVVHSTFSSLTELPEIPSYDCEELSKPPKDVLSTLRSRENRGKAHREEMNFYILWRVLFENQSSAERKVKVHYVSKLEICIVNFYLEDLTLFVVGSSGYTRVKHDDYYGDFRINPKVVTDLESCRAEIANRVHAASLLRLLQEIRNKSIRAVDDIYFFQYRQEFNTSRLIVEQDTLPNSFGLVRATDASLTCGSPASTVEVHVKVPLVYTPYWKLANRFTPSITGLFAPALCARATLLRSATSDASPYVQLGAVWVRLLT